MSEADFRRKVVSSLEWMCMVLTLSAIAQCTQTTAGINSKLDRIAAALESRIDPGAEP